MAANNGYLSKTIPNFYRREVMHIMIFTFIDTYRLCYPSVSIMEACTAFMKHYDINEDEYKTATVFAIYQRTNNDMVDAQRFQNKQKNA